MKTMNKGHRLDTVFVLIIFCIFAVSVLMVLMLGAGIYQNMTELSREQQNERTVLSYIRTKVRSNDENGRIYIGEFNGLPALLYDEEFDGRVFRTAIYHYDGYIYELYSEVGIDFAPNEGTQIMPLDSISFETLESGVIRVSAGTKSILLHIRTSSDQVIFDAFAEVIMP